MLTQISDGEGKKYPIRDPLLIGKLFDVPVLHLHAERTGLGYTRGGQKVELLLFWSLQASG